MEIVAGPRAPALRTERARGLERRQGVLARGREAAVFVGDAGQRLGHQRGNRRVAVGGDPLDALQQVAGQAEGDVLDVGHVNKCIT